MMSDEHPAEALIRWKTQAWQQPETVESYARRVADRGPALLKNRVEVRMFPRFVTGRDVLDVGVGTGRASRPLARDGYSVTGIDSSAAMLQKCRELAGTTPMSLVEGDVAALPFEDASFDTVMALNAFAHFPHWQSILNEWKRVLRPGGRLIFDVFSLDHDLAFARATGRPDSYAIEDLAPREAGAYRLRLRAEDLCAHASMAGLRVHALVPYGALCGQSSVNRFLGSNFSGYGWDRQLSWLDSDAKLFAFLLFAEEAIVGALTPSATWRYMAVLENAADPAANGAWLARNREREAALQHGLNAQTLQVLGLDAERLRRELHPHLEHAPNRAIFARMLLAALPWNWPVKMRDLVDAAHAEFLEDAVHRGSLDRIALLTIRSIAGVPAISQALTYAGIDLSGAFGYDMMSAVLDKGLHAFGEPA